MHTFGHVKQLRMLKDSSKSYGGTLRNRRGGRGARPLAVKQSMHMVLRSSKARGDWSFLKKKNYLAIENILGKFSKRHGVRIIHAANVGNHLHLHIQLGNRQAYRPFVRAITAAIAMAVTGRNRWTKSSRRPAAAEGTKFWDYRPFTRVIIGFRAILGLRDYIAINRLEGSGVSRETARVLVRSGSRYPCLFSS